MAGDAIRHSGIAALAIAAVLALSSGLPSLAQDGVLSVSEFLKLPAAMDGKRVRVRGVIYDADGVSADFADKGSDAKTGLDIETMDPKLRDYVYSDCAGVVVAPKCELVLEGEVVHFPARDGWDAYNDLHEAKAVRPLREA